ncbi:MAG: GIY-YIG nuclease family protein [Parcubacteria group bacterium]
MYYVYILKSLKDNGYYIGYTFDLGERIKKHNAGETKSLKYRRPLKIIYFEEYDTRQEAYKRERQIKKYKGGEAFKKLINRNLERCLSG